MTAGPDAHPVAPTREDPLVRWLSEGVGGPLGRRSAPGRSWWTPVRILVVLTLLAAGLGLLAKQPCRSGGWTVPNQYAHVCYSDIPPLYIGRGLDRGVVPYLDPPEPGTGIEVVEYPVLTGGAMWAVAQVVGDDVVDRPLRYFDLTALALALAAVVAVVATARTVRRRPWDAALVALAPGLVLTGTINWDLYAVALTSLALLAWSRARPGVAGALLGLAVAAKFYPLLLLGPLAVLCLRAGRMRAFATTLGAAGASWLIVNVPVMVASFEGWSRFYTFSQERGVSFSSVWYLAQLGGRGVPAEHLNAVASGSFLVCCLGIGLLGLLAPRRPRLASLCFLVVAAFALTNKVYSPQFVLWLLPLAALARPVWRDHLIWQLGQVIHFIGIWLHILAFDYPDRAISTEGYGATVMAHLAGTLWLVGVVVRDVWWPAHDPVRRDPTSAHPTSVQLTSVTPVDDPAGGVLDGAADAFALRRRESRAKPVDQISTTASG